MIVQILLLLTLWLIVCAVCFVVGFFVGIKNKPKEAPKTPPAPLTEEQERQIEKAQRELRNFWAYNGTNQNEE